MPQGRSKVISEAVKNERRKYSLEYIIWYSMEELLMQSEKLPLMNCKKW